MNLVNEEEIAFAMDTLSIKNGPGMTREVGIEMKQFGVTRVMVVIDPFMAKLEPVSIVMQVLREEGINAVLFDQVRIELTGHSFKEAIRFAADGSFLCRLRYSLPCHRIYDCTFLQQTAESRASEILPRPSR